MFQGKHIHYSPVDNKALCSYSNKLCRQRRLNGYGFCIRHILEDKSAPFKQCDYVTTRNNSQKCLNAIPSNQDRGYCHSHLQVIGIIPKTERKPKVAIKSGDNATNPKEKAGANLKQPNYDLATNANNHSSNNTTKNSKKKPKQSLSKLKDPTEKIQTNTITKSNTAYEQNNNNNTHSINFVKLNGLNNNVNVNPLELASQKQNQVSAIESAKVNTIKKNVKGKQQNHVIDNGNGIKKTPSVPAPTNKTQGKKKKTKSQQIPPEEKNDGSMSIHDRWKSFRFTKDDTNLADSKNKDVNNFRELKQKKIMEKLPLFAQIAKSTEKNEIMLSSSSYHGHQEQKYNNNSNYDNLSSSTEVYPAALLQLPKVDRHLELEVRLKNRKEFLLHVSSAFRSHLQTIRRVSKLNEKKDEGDKALRNSLLSCTLADPRLCAQILKYSTGRNSNSDNSTKHEQMNSTNASSPTGNLTGTKTRYKNTIGVPVKLEATSNDKSKSSHNQMLRIGNSTFSGNNKLKQEMNNTIVTNGLISLIDHPELKLLTEFNDEQSIIPLDDKFCDSSPWMNGGIDIDGDDDEYSLSRTSNRLLNKSNKELSASRTFLNMNSTSGSNSSKLLGLGGKAQLSKPNSFDFNGVPAESSIYGASQHTSTKKRRIELPVLQSGIDPNLNFVRQHNGLATTSAHSHNGIPIQPFCPDYGTSMEQLETALRSQIGSSNSSNPPNTSDVIANRTFDSPFDHSSSTNQPPDCGYNDDVADLADGFDLPIDQEIANQASKLLEDNGFTEDDFNDLFPETRSLTDHKFGDLGLDFSTAFDTSDIDYAFLANNFPNVRSNGTSESISATQNF